MMSRLNGTRRGIIMKNNKFLSKQTGGISKLMLIMIVAGVGYGAYFANKKGLIKPDSISSIANSMKTSISKTFTDEFTGYGVQLMATTEFEQAKNVMNDFSRDGYSAFVMESNAKGRSIYKVRLGPYAYKPEAVAVQDKVIRRYPNNPYVKSSLVIYKPN